MSCLLAASRWSVAAPLDEMSLDRWAKLREVERYQLQIAERYYRQRDWKVAAAEYEKYLRLYERSEAAPYAQLKWSLCQVQLHKANTAIKDGFQSVIDYWPDSPDAVAAAYYIGRTYKDMGRMAEAKKAYRSLLQRDLHHMAVIRALADLAEIAETEKDRPSQVALWKKLVFDVQRTRQTRPLCDAAAQRLASYYFQEGAFDEGRKALATTCTDEELPAVLAAAVKPVLRQLAAGEPTRAKSERLAAAAVAYLLEKTPAGPSDAAARQAARTRWLLAADLYAAAGLDAKVQQTYDRLRKQFGTDDQVLSSLAAWQKSRGRYDAARSTYRQFADRIEGQNQVALSYREQRNWDAAVGAYRQLVGRDPEHRARWQAEIAATYYQARRYDEAIATWKELLESDPEHAEHWRWQIACAYRDAGRWKDAIAWYRLCTNFPANYREMASCQRRLKQYREAIALYMQIASGHPPSAAWATFEIARTLEESGQKENAIKAFRQVCKRFPKDPYASRAHVHLQEKYHISVTLGGAKEQ